MRSQRQSRQSCKADVDTLVEEYYDKYQILLEGRDEAEFRRARSRTGTDRDWIRAFPGGEELSGNCDTLR